MAAVHEYKRLENNFVLKIKNLVKKAVGVLVRAVEFLYKAITQRFTIVLVPHSGKKVYNLQISFFSLCSVFLVLLGVLGAFFWYGSTYKTTQGALADKDRRLKDAQANLDQIRDEINQLMHQFQGFETTLSGTLSSLGTQRAVQQNAGPGQGDLASLFNFRETAEGALQEVGDVRSISAYLRSVEDPLREIETIIDSQKALLTETPNIWPIQGGIGHISMYFGQNENPFSGQYYIHKGIDLSTYRTGDPVVATADGQVVTMDYEADGFGNYIIIRHKHGFYTRYAHLASFSSQLSNGRRVQQGDVIGRVGNTGLSTGPHLHYEVRIGSDVVDPYKYLNIRTSVARGSAGTGKN